MSLFDIYLFYPKMEDFILRFFRWKKASSSSRCHVSVFSKNSYSELCFKLRVLSTENQTVFLSENYIVLFWSSAPRFQFATKKVFQMQDGCLDSTLHLGHWFWTFKRVKWSIREKCVKIMLTLKYQSAPQPSNDFQTPIKIGTRHCVSFLEHMQQSLIYGIANIKKSTTMIVGQCIRTWRSHLNKVFQFEKSLI